MFSLVLCAATSGIRAHLVRVETHIAPSIPSFSIVGLPDTSVRESRSRVYAAIKSAGFRFPPQRLTVNLSPADLRKEGSGFDLSIAVGLLAASGQVSSRLLDRYILLGELALDGTLAPIRGVLSISLEAARRGLRGIVVPGGNGREASLVGGIDIIPVENLNQTAAFLDDRAGAPLPLRFNALQRSSPAPSHPLDFADVKGQANAKRALEVAAAGGHNIMMIGPPGSGKSMLAKRIPSILPPLTFHEAVETTQIHSVAGLLPRETPLITSRPFRAPHHTISTTALVGGGVFPRPGEISLAHHGVLFLDEMPEFSRRVLEAVRQPLEEGCITISRIREAIEFPAAIMLVCAMNPCFCGNFTDPSEECTCTPLQVQKYMAKISGPVLDRIDLHIEVPAVKFKELSSNVEGESSQSIRERVVDAREIQMKRLAGRKGMNCNADMQSKEIRSFCKLDSAGEELLKMAITKLGLSARAYDRILKVGRTIADLAHSAEIRPEHVSEAIQYRSLDRNLWESHR